MISIRRSARTLAPVLMLGLTLTACGTVNPATGRRDFTPFMSPSQEVQIGKENHPQVMAEHGGVYDDPKIGGYVASVGGRLAANSEMTDYPFTFTVLNSPIVNAFALPGGYVYVTRGILALFNDEAELASVLGHEIGHVTARHSAKRYNQSMFAGLGGAILGIATGSSALGQLANYGSQLYLLGYSRDQEYQSDELGIRYMAKAGYDPYGSPDMLRALLAQDQLESTIAQRENAERPPEFFSTHPNTENRVQRATELAAATGVQPGARPRLSDRYLEAIDGMLYGDDPEQGLIRGQVFWHPKLKLTFTAPPQYQIINTSQAVIMQGPQGNVAQFVGGAAQSGDTTEQVMNRTWAQIAKDLPLQGAERVTINGMEAVTAWARANSQQGPVIARLLTIRYAPTQTYSFLMLTPEKVQPAVAEELQRMTYSFRKLADNEVNKIKPLRIRIVTVKQGDSHESLAKRMAFEDYQLERFRTLNGLRAGDSLRAGQRVKLIVEE